MTEFTFSPRRRLSAPALWATAALAGILLYAGGPAAAEDAANPNVIVDNSVLDGSTSGSANSEVLPAPAHQPVSRLVTEGQSAVEAATPPETTSETTDQAVPTTPIESTDLDGSQEPQQDFEAAPAAGTTAEGEATPAQPAAAAETPPPTEGSGGTPAATPATDTQTAGGAPASAPTEQQTAAKPPIDGMVRLTFEPEASKVSDATKADLGALIEKLKTDYMLRLQILAYAGGDDSASSHARGVSLARALAMRDYLTEQGVTVERMDIKALGNTAQEEPADRVDLIPLTE
jgi:outer membrane protein OmpA-like peptidoglycan-associated protein